MGSEAAVRAMSRNKTRQIGGLVALLLTVGAVVALGAGDALGQWGARKAPRPKARTHKVRKPRAGNKQRPSAAAKQVKAAPVEPLIERVNRALSRGHKLRVAVVMPLLREAVARREMGTAVRIAEAIEAARRVSGEQLVDAARALGGAQQHAVQLRLWERAHRSRGPAWLRIVEAQGYFDALLAAGRVDEARKVLESGLSAARLGFRRPLLERLVAWGRLAGKAEQVRDELLGYRDPDAMVLAARLVSELQGDDEGLAVLRRGWRRFAGHRWLQAEYLLVLSRLGYREELVRAVRKVVALSPSDPMPWLRVVDAYIGARDSKGARRLIDTLLAKYARNDALIEALIDREQRMKDGDKRVGHLYLALLRAAPRQSSYIEAYAEWLLSRGPAHKKAAMSALQRLDKLAAGKVEGRRRAAAILQAHGHTGDAMIILLDLDKRHPDDPRVQRQLAILYSQVGRGVDAERRWLKLARLDRAAQPDARQAAAEARRNLAILYRRGRSIGSHITKLRATVQGGKASLGDVLLLLDLLADAQADEGREVAVGEVAGLAPWMDDREVIARLAKAHLRAGHRDRALAAVTALWQLDRDTARFMLLEVIERALAAGDKAAANSGEKLLLSAADTSTALLLRLGNLRLRYGDRDGAATLFKRAAVQNPRDTRAMYRLAQLFRQDGKAEGEAAALREIVLQTTDRDELEKAGHRLLTLAMTSGTCAELLRWLDAIMPRHPRRSILSRFNMLAYDAWLRGEPLEQRLAGKAAPGPGPGLLNEALTGGDLALKVRALRQIARTKRMMPIALARRLLKDENAVVRRDATLALAASGRTEAAELLVEVEYERTDVVVVARLLAFARLPAFPAAIPVLENLLTDRTHHWALLAALALGRVGEANNLTMLLERLRTSAQLRGAAAIAVGNLIGRFPDSPAAREAVALLALHSRPEPQRDNVQAWAIAYAALWGLAATGRDDAREVLLSRAVSLQSAVLRKLALRLAAAQTAPKLDADLFALDLSWQERHAVGQRVMRKLLLPWLTPAPDLEAQAVGRFDRDLSERLKARLDWTEVDSSGAQWCRGFARSLSATTEVGRLCSAASAR